MMTPSKNSRGHGKRHGFCHTAGHHIGVLGATIGAKTSQDHQSIAAMEVESLLKL